ncbi:MAG: hypothetical protein FD156_204 [Nitrospirae bacterium]|nr:MAG: hypothetical protein FD156_204 [Nitrospirota bacterium]
MAKTNLKVVESKRDSLAEACKVAEKFREQGNDYIYSFLKKKEEPVDEKIHVLVRETLVKLAPLKAMLEDEDMEKLDDFYKLTATIDTVREIHNLLTAADDMYFTVH